MIRYEPGYTRRRVGLQLFWFACWLAVTAVAIFLSPHSSGHGTHMQLGLPPCPSVLVWDRPCPGCGLTTSVSAAVRADFGLAWKAHPFGLLLYVVFTAYALAGFAGWLRGRRLTVAPRMLNWGLAILFVAYLAHGTARFFLSEPFGEGGVLNSGAFTIRKNR